VRLILASASPRRAELLRAAGYDFDVVVADVDESIRVGESPAAYVRRLASAKSSVASGFSRTMDGRDGPTEGGLDAPIFLGADTAVVVGDEILGKPRDDDEAAAMVRRLSGRQHEVMTGVSVRRGAFEMGRVDVTVV
jgi:septum formation protein